MAYTALYREYRPKTFEDVVGQVHITTTLKNAIKTERIAHAYLLCGTRGTGKTSTAKIISKAVNCLNPKEGEPCNECDMCNKINSGTAIDVIELDAASHNGVDNIRDIIEDVQYPPQEAKYKVYIIDEVHMLSVGAVNAFLKTLEEPPNRVIFILATTDPQKLPITILSRCQRFDFKRIKNKDIFLMLRNIIDHMGVYAEDKSLELVSRISDGAARDALSILDQAISMSNGKVEYENIVQMLGLMTNEGLIKLTDAVIDKDIEKSIREINEIVQLGKDIHLFIKDMTTHMRNLMMIKISDNPDDVLDMSIENIELLKSQAHKIRVEEIMRYIKILQEAEDNSKYSKQGRIYLELAVIKMCKVEYDTSMEIMLSRLNKIEESIKNGTIKVSENKISEINNIKKVNAPISKPKTESVVKEDIADMEVNDDTYGESNITLEMVKKSFKDIQQLLKGRKNMVLAAALMVSEVNYVKGNVINIIFSKEYSFHKNRLEKDDSKKIIDDIFSEILKEKVRVTYSIDEPKDVEKPKEEILFDTFSKDLVEIVDE
ncbi:DNA polymerase III, subunit gamma and tau [Clostridium argentinense CDC 2741]|uniref:DNA-directed DNA polymerase n=1 Tax=Clostridium argentinense CDC 2741 TaxID=1418104 RepID=A0A0C1R4I6_9CLOT|nr:DNA polymerase III subunit gamma/tau [Clostridium argentinense]ARC83287.1 DNA polymerase III subunit gamma/tau [Clostridium argentinense]KIE48412.1 DNA polymerase III, subunit gamma and tau [Clostridium argentinense CDC 2741]NFF41454.1 DNA polymerase III subunit gamma/tau [Clostridium argentinense]NFP52116.1 DNA polymerase III subunit gamma/tau [Clostridium argentinense]NFP74493.1 DNA polymerase III subunit gamma/tau [Clostridium argentinense]